MPDLNRVAVVTGGLGILGQAVCKRLAADGWRIAVLDTAPSGSVTIKNVHVHTPVDLRSPDAVSTAAAQIRKWDVSVGALVNVAGGFRWETVQDGQVESWDWLYETNVKTALVTTREFLPDLAKCGNGRIVNVGAASAARAGTGMGAYSASKSAVLRLTEALAEEWKQAGLTANAVLPSIIDTPANRAAMPNADFSRWVAPDDVAAVVAFLVSPEARAVTGAGIPVTGRT
ncbi:MAG: SDR family NAD(P)-dependent oxidoreductase [Betaproteobacteria bacterium]|nr:SDR family NAD(P)-dependent oxidoreductase [Betaproteobacteria bacterium]